MSAISCRHRWFFFDSASPVTHSLTAGPNNLREMLTLPAWFLFGSQGVVGVKGSGSLGGEPGCYECHAAKER